MRSWVLGIFFVSLPAFAQPQQRDPVAAEALFRDGREAFKKGDWPTACPKFAESMRLDPAVGTLYNLADCEEHWGKIASSWVRWEAVVDMLRTNPTDERYAIAKKHAADLLPRLPRLNVHWSGPAPSNVTVKRDGIEIGSASLGTAIPVDAGKHTIEVTASDRKPRTFEITTKEGEIADLPIAPGDPIETTVVQPDKEKEPKEKEKEKEPDKGWEKQPRTVAKSGGSSPLLPIGWTAFTIGAVSAVAGIITGIGAIAQKGTVESECSPTTKLCSENGASAASTGHTLAGVSTATIIIGSIAGGLGLTFVIIGAATSKPRTEVSFTGDRIVLGGTF